MDSEEMKHLRTRRATRLCLSCIRNLAYKRTRHKSLLRGADGQFWRTVDANFIDISTLDWYKLFCYNRGRHHYKKVVINHNAFLNTMLENINCGINEFNSYIDAIKKYRDKFIAHLDNETIMNIPHLSIARCSTMYLYNHLRDGKTTLMSHFQSVRHECSSPDRFGSR